MNEPDWTTVDPRWEIFTKALIRVLPSDEVKELDFTSRNMYFLVHNRGAWNEKPQWFVVYCSPNKRYRIEQTANGMIGYSLLAGMIQRAVHLELAKREYS